MSGQIWIQIVWHSDGTPERINKKKDFESSQETTKRTQKYPIGNSKHPKFANLSLRVCVVVQIVWGSGWGHNIPDW